MDDIYSQIAEAEIKRRDKYKDSFHEFFLRFVSVVLPDKIKPNFHHGYLCDQLEIIGKNLFKRNPKLYDLNINIPPGELKSTIVSQLFPVWLWINDPTLVVITGSNTSKLANKNAIKSRQLINSKEFKNIFGSDAIELQRDQNNKSYYATIQGGARISCSVGSSIIGEHADIIIIDDPIDPKSTHSIAKIESVNEWMDVALPTRKKNAEVTPTILNMQRLSMGDPSEAFVENSLKIKSIVMPSESNYPILPDNDFEYKGKPLSHYYVDGLFNPERKSVKILKEYENKLGSVNYAAQLNQSPNKLDGNIIKRDSITVMSPNDLPFELNDIAKKFYSDLAYTDREENDPSGTLVTKYYKNDLYILDYLGFKTEGSETKTTVIDFMDSHNSSRSEHWIENKGPGLTITSILRKEHGINAIDYVQKNKDKMTRLTSVLGPIESGRVIFVKGRYLEEYLNALFMFPKTSRGKHAEEVDTLVMAILNNMYGEGRRKGGKRRITSR